MIPGVEDLEADVAILALSARDQEKLLKDLDKAKKDLAKGNTKGAVKKLESFIKNVQKLIDKGDVSDVDGDSLSDDAQFLIDIINDPSTGS